MGKLDTQKAHKSLGKAEKKKAQCTRNDALENACNSLRQFTFHGIERHLLKFTAASIEMFMMLDIPYLSNSIEVSLFHCPSAWFFSCPNRLANDDAKKVYKTCHIMISGQKRKYKFAVFCCVFLRSSESQLAI
jgi:hypothetical protein